MIDGQWFAEFTLEMDGPGADFDHAARAGKTVLAYGEEWTVVDVDRRVTTAGLLRTAVSFRRALSEAPSVSTPNAPDGSHCRSCCYLQAPCDEHKGGTRT